MSIETEQEHASQVIAELYQNSFFNRYWRAIGKFIGRGKPVSIWVSVAVVMVANLLLGITVSALLKERQFTTLSAILVNVMWVTWAYFAIPVTLITNGRLVEFLRLRFIQSLENEQHLHELLLWANRWLGRQVAQFLVPLVLGLAAALWGFYGIYPTAKFSFGEVLIYFINFFHMGIAFYTVLSLHAFMLKLKNWDLVLFSDDPASSPILLQLSKEIRNFSLIIAIINAVLFISLSLIDAINTMTILLYIVTNLIPISDLFVIGNQAFSQQIMRVKYERLGQLQSEIMKLSSNIGKMDTDTIARVKSLMDYHDRVKSSRNSLYNAQSFINLFGSLALPVLSAILSTIDVWQKIFGKP